VRQIRVLHLEQPSDAFVAEFYICRRRSHVMPGSAETAIEPSGLCRLNFRPRLLVFGPGSRCGREPTHNGHDESTSDDESIECSYPHGGEILPPVGG
jgi:hypothetical protein